MSTRSTSSKSSRSCPRQVRTSWAWRCDILAPPVSSKKRPEGLEHIGTKHSSNSCELDVPWCPSGLSLDAFILEQFPSFAKALSCVKTLLLSCQQKLQLVPTSIHFTALHCKSRGNWRLLGFSFDPLLQVIQVVGLVDHGVYLLLHRLHRNPWINKLYQVISLIEKQWFEVIEIIFILWSISCHINMRSYAIYRNVPIYALPNMFFPSWAVTT